MISLLFQGLFAETFAEESIPAAHRISPVPAVSGKVVRYTQFFVRRHDTSGDGILQREEWATIPGNPTAIDMNGDGHMTAEEIVWYFDHYAQSRTIHRTIKVDLSEPYRFDPENLKLFRPALQRVNVQAKDTPAISAEDTTETMIQSHDQPIDDDAYAKMLAERQIPSDRPFYASPENIRGVPPWFVMQDKNGDGQISLAEFAPSLSPESVNLFRRLDKDGNGFIEPAEVRAAP